MIKYDKYYSIKNLTIRSYFKEKLRHKNQPDSIICPSPPIIKFIFSSDLDESQKKHAKIMLKTADFRGSLAGLDRVLIVYDDICILLDRCRIQLFFGVS